MKDFLENVTFPNESVKVLANVTHCLLVYIYSGAFYEKMKASRISPLLLMPQKVMGVVHTLKKKKLRSDGANKCSHY